MSESIVNQEIESDHDIDCVAGSESVPNQQEPQALDNLKKECRERQPILKEELKPDHGENFVPGSESAPDHLAPQPLDHFKRGYRERADLRDRETNQLANDFDPNTESKPSPPVVYNGRLQVRINRHPSVQQHSEFRNNYRGASGFDAVRLVETLIQGCNLYDAMDRAKENYCASFQSGKALTAILSNLARKRKKKIASSVWYWMDERGIEKNVFHYNSLISVCEKVKDNQRALQLLEEMEKKGIQKNEVTFSSAISACEKAGQWRVALDLLERMKKEGVGRTAIAYNAAISACEKGLVPHKALELFEQMKRENVKPTVITYSALISAAEKGQQWKLALEVLEEMKAEHGANVIAYSAAISALSKGQMWEKALELFREIESSGNTPSIVTYNATMTALEKGLQWERALDLFDEMKSKRLSITVVSYGSAISACEKGLQYRQCLEYLDEMTELGIKKNVIIFGAAMSCMEKCCRADIAFQLMERMKIEGVAPNVHIYNSAISACARCGLWEKGLELFEEMEEVGVVRDVVSFNAVLDAVCSQVRLGRQLFELGIEKGFYARVSRLGTQWLELDLHFLSLGGGEIALGWWFEECLVPYLVNTSKLAAVKSIDIVTGYGKTRMRGVRHGDDGMRKRVRAMLQYMNIKEVDQPNKGRIHIDKEALITEVQMKDGKIKFDEEGYLKFKEQNTTANHIPDVSQKVRPRFRPMKRFPIQDNLRKDYPRGSNNYHRLKSTTSSTNYCDSRYDNYDDHYDTRNSSGRRRNNLEYNIKNCGREMEKAHSNCNYNENLGDGFNTKNNEFHNNQIHCGGEQYGGYSQTFENSNRENQQRWYGNSSHYGGHHKRTEEYHQDRNSHSRHDLYNNNRSRYRNNRQQPDIPCTGCNGTSYSSSYHNNGPQESHTCYSSKYRSENSRANIHSHDRNQPRNNFSDYRYSQGEEKRNTTSTDYHSNSGKKSRTCGSHYENGTRRNSPTKDKCRRTGDQTFESSYYREKAQNNKNYGKCTYKLQSDSDDRRYDQDAGNCLGRNSQRQESQLNGYSDRYTGHRHRSRSRERIVDIRNSLNQIGTGQRMNGLHHLSHQEKDSTEGDGPIVKKRGYDIDCSTTSFSGVRGF